MTNVIDYKSVPSGFAHCFNSECPQAGNCLRHQVATLSAEGPCFIKIINPSHFPAPGETCDNFKPNQKQPLAWGMSRLFDSVSYKEAPELRRQMIAHFTKPRYYRFFRKEYPLTPDDQLYIRQLFKGKGIAAEPVFDAYTEDYDW